MTVETIESVETEKTEAEQAAEQTETLARAFENRAAVYGLISRLFRVEIDQAFLDELRAKKFPAATGNENVNKGYRLIARALSKVRERTLTEFAIDYARTFCGTGFDAYSAAYPYESVYTSPKRLMMQDARDEVLAVFRANGIDRDPSWKEGEDHIALELEFMQVLSMRTAEALRNGDEAALNSLLLTQQGFLDAHLQAWVPMMVADMHKFSKNDLYKGLGYLTLGWLDSDEEFLDDMLAEESADKDE